MVILNVKMHFILLFCMLLTVFQNFGNSIIQKGNIEDCENDDCLKNNSKVNNGSLYETLNNKSNNFEHKEKNDLNVPTQQKSYDLESSHKVLLNNNKTLGNTQHTTEYLELEQNILESFSVAVNETESKKNSTFETRETIFTNSQFVTEATTKTTSTTQISSFSNDYTPILNMTINDNNGVCFCDLTMNECDINCCCDLDCELNQWKVFSHCQEPNMQQSNLNCYKDNYIFKSNINLKVVHKENALFCITKNNLKSNLMFQNKELITSLKVFHKTLPVEMYSFALKEMSQHKFEAKRYIAGSFIWILKKGVIKPFALPEQTLGLTCTSYSPVKYLINQIRKCSHHVFKKGECENMNAQNIIEDLTDMIIIAHPHFINKSLNYQSLKVCQSKVCILPDVHICQNSRNCTVVSSQEKSSVEIRCNQIVSRISFRIWHNGTDGIKKFDVLVYLRNITVMGMQEGKILQTMEVEFKWTVPLKNVFKKSGNPGYLTGKPILTCRKRSMENGTGIKKDIMEWSPFGSSIWMDVLGSEKGFCSPRKRIPISFQENSYYSCLIELSKENFTKENCKELQKHIFRLLLGDDLVNVTSENYYNKFVATFGNSKLEDMEDWIQVLIDLFPIASSQVDSKFGHGFLICRNIVSDLVIEVAYSKVGSFVNPQAKILGVSFQFGRHKDLKYYCDSFLCETTTASQLFKLSSTVNFIDLTEPVIDVFAEPLGLEVKLPHDFFYPFFSKASGTQSLSKFVSGLFLFTLFGII